MAHQSPPVERQRAASSGQVLGVPCCRVGSLHRRAPAAGDIQPRCSVSDSFGDDACSGQAGRRWWAAGLRAYGRVRVSAAQSSPFGHRSNR